MSKDLDVMSLDFIETAGEGLKAAEYLANAIESQQAKLAAQAPELARQMVALKLIDASEQEKAAGLLQDPLECHNILGRLLRMRSKEAADAAVKTAGELGLPVPSRNETFAHESPFVGARGGNVKRASDQALLRLAGLAS